MREQPLLLEHRELVADRRRAVADVGVGGERLGAHGLAGLGEAVDHFAEQELLARGEHPLESKNHLGLALADDPAAVLLGLGLDLRHAVARR